MLSTLALRDVYIAAQLVNNAICGGASDGEFRCDIEIMADELDENGFVTDNKGFISRLKEKFGGDLFSTPTFKASCEELGHGIAAFAHEVVGERLVGVKVRVYNLTGHVDSQWSFGDEVPAFPRLATPDEERLTKEAKKSGRRSRGC